MSQRKPKTKVIVQNLPPFLSKDKFVPLLAPWEGQYDYFAYFQGKKTFVLSYTQIQFSIFLNVTKILV